MFQKQFRHVITRFVNNLEKFTSTLKNQNIKDCFQELYAHTSAKAVRERLKMRLAKYWARRMTAKVFTAIKENNANKEEEREMNFKCIIFENRRIQKQAFTQDRRVKNSNTIFIDSYFASKGQKKLQQDILKQWRLQIYLAKDRSQFLGKCLDLLQLKKGFQSLQSYSSVMNEIIDHVMKRRWFNFIKQYKTQQIAKRSINQRMKQIYFQNLKRTSLQDLKNGCSISKQIRENFGDTILKVYNNQRLKDSLVQIEHFGNFKVVIKQIVERGTKYLLSKGFRQLQINSKLKVFSEELMIKIKIGKYLIQWKESALEDRRIVKLMARAAKHCNRKLKQRYFLNLKRKICPGLFILPKRRMILQSRAIEAFKRFRMQTRVHNFKVQKVKQKTTQQCKVKYFTKWYELTSMQLHCKQLEQRNEQQSQEFYMRKHLSKSLRAWKNYTYLQRVHNYISQRQNTKFLALYLKRMKEIYIQNQTEKLRERRGIQTYLRVLKKKAIFVLDHYSKSKQQGKAMSLKAYGQYNFLQYKKCMISFYQNFQHQKKKRLLMENAIMEYQTSQMRLVFTKMLQVGFYWATIHQRFGISSRQSRIYLGLKYGMRWRAKTLIIKFIRQQHTQNPNQSHLNRKTKQVKIVDKMITQAVSQQVIQLRSQQTSSQISGQLKAPLFAQNSPLRPLNLSQTRNKPTSNLIPHSFALSQSPNRLGLQRQNSASSLQQLQQSQNQQRLKEIEQEILTFKNKKSLLKELESQIKLIQQNGGQGSILELMKGKYMALRNEIVQIQPKIKSLLEEIARLKSGGQQALSQTQSYQIPQVGAQGDINQTFLSQNDPSFMLSKTMITSFMHQ